MNLLLKDDLYYEHGQNLVYNLETQKPKDNISKKLLCFVRKYGKETFEQEF